MEKPILPSNLKPLSPERRTYNAAKQFSVASLAIINIPNGPKGPVFPIQPYITCVSFSIELYLKCILLSEGVNDIHGHKLVSLFGRMTQESRNNVLFYLRGAFKNLSLSSEFLDSELSAIDSAFVEWRYVHEKEFASINLEFLRKFAWACQMHVRYMKPDWFPASEGIPSIGS